MFEVVHVCGQVMGARARIVRFVIEGGVISGVLLSYSHRMNELRGVFHGTPFRSGNRVLRWGVSVKGVQKESAKLFLYDIRKWYEF